MCGEFSVRIHGRDVTDQLPGLQGRSLFAFLVLNRGKPVTRGELIEVLWPEDQIPANPGANLNVLLTRLRKSVGDGVIAGRTQLSVCLDDDAEVDVEVLEDAADRVETALRSGDLTGAAEAADAGLEIAGRGALLPAVDAPWVDERRRRLREIGDHLAEVQGRVALANGGPDLVRAERIARSLIDRDPLRESSYALLMEAQERQGNRAAALLTYDGLRRKLQEELGVVPSAELRTLSDRLLHHDLPTAPSTADDGEVPIPETLTARDQRPFIGRSWEIERVRDAWADTCRGRWRFVRVNGRPGIGKTWLAARVAQEVSAGPEPATVLYGRCDEESVVPYQPFVEALRHYVRHWHVTPDADLRSDLETLAHLVPEIGRLGIARSGDHEKPRHALFDAVASLLWRWAATRPLLLVLDDMQWADTATPMLLRHLLRHTEDSRLMVLATFRAGTSRSGDIVADLAREHESRADELELDGFDGTATDAMAATRLGVRPTDGFVRALRAKTDGNPFFIEETLRSLAESGGLADGREASEQLLDDMKVPARVQQLTLRRLRATSSQTVEAMVYAAVIAQASRTFELRTLVRVLDAHPAAVLDALEEAREAGLIADVAGGPNTYTFCHALVREAIYDGQPRDRRIRRHAEVAEALEAHGDVPGAEVASHFTAAEPLLGPRRAFDHLVRAGQQAAEALAYEEAEAFYERALAALEPVEPADEEQRDEVRLALGRVRWQAGDRGARECFQDVAASALRRRAPKQLARAALGLAERSWEADAGDAERRDYLGAALELLAPEPSVLRARVLALLGETQHFTADAAEGARNSSAALAMARELIEASPPGGARERAQRSALVYALVGHHIALLDIDHLEVRLELIREAHAVTDIRPELAGKVLHWWLFDLCELGQAGAARARLADLEALAGELHQPVFEHVAAAWQGVFVQLGADVAEAEHLAQKAHRIAQRANTRTADSTFNAQLFTIRRRQGRTTEMLEAFEAVTQGPIAPIIWRAALAVAQLEAEEPDAARAGYERFAERDFPVPHGFLRLATLALLAELCAGLDDTARAPLLYATLAPYRDRFIQVGLASSWGSVERHLGLLSAASGNLASAEQHLARAAERNAEFGSPVLEAEARCDLAAVLARGERRDRAAEIAGDVAAFADRHGMTALAERAERVRR
jgi:DNA-binding SARP family transcriptional activator